MKTTPQWLLRRFAGRAIRVLERHIDRAPALSIYSETIAKTAPAFIALYDRSHARTAALSDARTHRSGAIDQLARSMRAWSAALVNDLPGFDRAKYGDKPNVPEDVIDDGQSMIVLLDEHEQAGGTPPFYADTLRADLELLIEAANADLARAGSQSAGLSDLKADVRKAAIAFHRDLVAFRAALRALVGSHHSDYQKLRVARGATPDVDDEGVEEALPDGEHVDAVEDVADVEAAEVSESEVAEAS